MPEVKKNRHSTGYAKPASGLAASPCSCRGPLQPHADAFAQRGVRMDGLADIDRIGAHLDGQRNLANHVARMRADHAAAQYLAVAMRFRRVVEQQLGEAFVAAIGKGAAGCGPGEQARKLAMWSVTGSPGID